VFTTVTLSDGRTLEYAELGTPSGHPVLFFHGTPATGGQAAVVADAARAQGLRLVAPTRAGYGDSTLSPPGLAATAVDVLALADQLSLERFSVMGVSGGGPFALALAAVAPDRVTTVAVHAGAASFSEVMPEKLEEDDRRALAMLADGDVDGAVAIETALAEADLGGLRGLSDAEFAEALRSMAPPGESWLDRHAAARDAFESDFRRAITTCDGCVRDNLSWLGAWDVDLGTISTSVRLVYGESDGMSPLANAEWLRARLPDSDLHVVPGGRHGDVCFGAAADTFAAIASG
jgi:pimeloyl-ACP methyl ester carboxylesterase